MELNYPGDKLEIIVSSDGSTDKTSEICQRYVKVKFLDLAREHMVLLFLIFYQELLHWYALI